MGAVTIKVKDIEGVDHAFVVDKDEPMSIVDIAQENGVELPYSCRSGACFTCCAEIKKWQEHLDREKTGEQLIDVEENEFLCCIWWVKTASLEDAEDSEIELEMLN